MSLVARFPLSVAAALVVFTGCQPDVPDQPDQPLDGPAKVAGPNPTSEKFTPPNCDDLHFIMVAARKVCPNNSFVECTRRCTTDRYWDTSSLPFMCVTGDTTCGPLMCPACPGE